MDEQRIVNAIEDSAKKIRFAIGSATTDVQNECSGLKVQLENISDLLGKILEALEKK